MMSKQRVKRKLAAATGRWKGLQISPPEIKARELAAREMIWGNKKEMTPGQRRFHEESDG